MAYDFTRFSSKSFERFVQAFAVGICGELTQIYGSGADGGREATFEGRCRIGSEEWDGYVVFQAKHREHPGSPSDNEKWLIEQVDAEFAKFANPRRGLRTPEYYVLASNVRLSATAADAAGKREGGVDHVTRHLLAKAQDLGVRGIAVWHQDTLSAMLDVYPDIRTTFDFWVQPSDVLAAILRQLSGPNRADVLADFLAEGLRQSREIKTRDVGQAIGRTVNLDEVFVDLPVERTESVRVEVSIQATDPSLEVEDVEGLDVTASMEEVTWQTRRSTTVVSELMREASDLLAHASADRNKAGGRSRRTLRGRVVLLGGAGPGQVNSRPVHGSAVSRETSGRLSGSARPRDPGGHRRRARPRTGRRHLPYRSHALSISRRASTLRRPAQCGAGQGGDHLYLGLPRVAGHDRSGGGSDAADAF